MVELDMDTWLRINRLDEDELRLVRAEVDLRLGGGIDIESMGAEEIESIRDRCTARMAELRKAS